MDLLATPVVGFNLNTGFKLCVLNVHVTEFPLHCDRVGDQENLFDVFKRAGDPFSVSSSLGDPIRRVPVRPLGELHLEDQVE